MTLSAATIGSSLLAQVISAPVWWIGPGVVLVMIGAAIAWTTSLRAEDRRRGSIWFGTLAAIFVWTIAWSLIRLVLGPTPPSLEGAFLQLAFMPISMFVGAGLGMVRHRLRFGRSIDSPRG